MMPSTTEHNYNSLNGLNQNNINFNRPSNKRFSKKVFFEKTASVILALLIWQVASLCLNSTLLLVSPIKVIQQLFSLCTETSFWKSILFSLWRITAGFLLAFFIGFTLACLSAKFHVIKVFLWPYITVAKSVPVASFIILCLIFFSSSTLSIFISFLMVMPIIYTNILEGILQTDKNLLEMASVYRMSTFKKFFYIYIPQLKPYIITSCSLSLGISWKSGVAAEVIGIPAGSIGEKLYNAKVYLSSADLLAWTVVIIVISALCEKLFMFLLKRAYKRLESK